MRTHVGSRCDALLKGAHATRPGPSLGTGQVPGGPEAPPLRWQGPLIGISRRDGGFHPKNKIA